MKIQIWHMIETKKLGNFCFLCRIYNNSSLKAKHVHLFEFFWSIKILQALNFKLQMVYLYPAERNITRWTFFRVKLVFEYDFEISWSFGLWNPWTFRPRECQFFTSSLLHHLLILLPTSFLLVWFGKVWYGLVWGGGVSYD